MISTKIKRTGVIATEVAVLALAKVQFASASCDSTAVNGGATGGANCATPTGVPSNLSVGGLFGLVANVLIFAVGGISVIVLIIGGLRYVVSAGNAAQVQGAKNTILYAIVGIVIAIASYAIVNFVFTQLGVQ